MRVFKSPLLLIGLATVIVLAILIVAFGQSNNTPQTTTDSTSQNNKPEDTQTQTKPQETTPEYDIRVNFSKNPESYNDFTFTQSVNRKTNRIDVGTFAIEQLIAGPTADESAQGLFSPLQNKFSGNSTCSGADFSLNVSNVGTATVKFCRDLVTAGIGEDALIKETITKTLKQFSMVYKVVILDKNGNCFGDMSGQNQCLN